ncbi:MAG: metal ABC transporter ATP-binding protein [Duncaniella sp.]|nr:metal ABC transporter ATP-binding protein [Duncaniella sp.]MDE6178125.1 metal ABC transporter ATP-binding protein [Duncaniella sp.]MDE6391065.1 metal ABC transporter ATP-binding protein [Duncaniella sp.]
MEPKEILISLRGISLRRDSRVILDDINFDIRRGDFAAITGPNGGGKTSLLRIILGLLKPSEGTVAYPCGKVPTGYLPQKNMIDSRFPITVSEVVRSGLTGSGLARAEEQRLTAETLAAVGLSDHASKSIGVLSGGQLQRALLGRALISSPRLLVLDEPLSYVDKQFEQRIYSLVEELSHRTTILLVSHEMSTIAGMANRHLIIDRRLTECHSSRHRVRCECDEG